MQEIGAFDAKTHFAQLLNKVKEGECISITRHGVPIAVLVPIKKYESNKKTVLVENFRQWRKGICWDAGMDTKTAVKEGRR